MAVTLLAAFNDPDSAVEIVLNRRLWLAEAVLCHPLINTEPLALPHDHWHAFSHSPGAPRAAWTCLSLLRLPASLLILKGLFYGHGWQASVLPMVFCRLFPCRARPGRHVF